MAMHDFDRDVIVGVKVRVSRNASGEQGTVPLLIVRQATERLGMSMMIHIGEPPPTLDEVQALMRRASAHALLPAVSEYAGDGRLQGRAVRP